MELRIEYVSPDALEPAGYNPRKISDRALEALARLMDVHGFVDPIIARRGDGLVLGGHQRLKANALRCNPDALVPVVFLDEIPDDRAKALNIALNNPQAQGQYDTDMLSSLLEDLDLTGLEVEQSTGFDSEQIADLIRDSSREALNPACDLGATGLPWEADGPGDSPAGQGDGALTSPEVVIVFELDRRQYAAAREHFDHLIDAHDLARCVQFEDQR